MSVITKASVEKEYEKNPDIKPSEIQRLRDWLTQQPHLPHEYITDLDLILAYHRCGGCRNLTERVIDLNFTMRTMFTFYQNRKIDAKLKNALDTWLITPLQTNTKQGYKAIYCQLLDADLQKFVYEDAVRAFVMILDLWLSEEGTSPGTVIIVNMDQVSVGHLSQINLTVAQQFFCFLQEAMFVQLKEFHFINAPSFVDKLMSMVMPFMKKGLLDVMKVHQAGSRSAEEYIPIEALPKEAGGTKSATEMREEIWNKLKANEVFFEEEANKRVDESKRVGRPFNMSNFCSGMESTFKSLEID